MKDWAWFGMEMSLVVKVVGSNAGDFPPLFLFFNWQDLPLAWGVWPLLDRTDSQDFVCESVWRGAGTFQKNGMLPLVYGELGAVY